ncbi:MAG: hypothetical protein ACK5JR_02880 [Tropicimonas sp.]
MTGVTLQFGLKDRGLRRDLSGMVRRLEDKQPLLNTLAAHPSASE